MKGYLLLILLFLTPLLGACSIQLEKNDKSQEQSLKLTLQFEKPTYHPGESVIAIITLENVGNETVLVNSRMSVNLPFESSPIREIAFDVTTPSGENYWPDVNISPSFFEIRYFIELRPGETFESTVYLSSYSYKFTESGVYKVVANYQNYVDPSYVDPEDDRVAWKGELNSNEILLTIVP
jgi:hypothetical protein